MTILPGDIVTVRTYVTGRKTNARVLFVNHKYGWFTGLVRAQKGNYAEAFWMRDLDDPNKQEAKKKRSKYLREDDPDAWLSEWSEDEYGK